MTNPTRRGILGSIAAFLALPWAAKADARSQRTEPAIAPTLDPEPPKLIVLGVTGDVTTCTVDGIRYKVTEGYQSLMTMHGVDKKPCGPTMMTLNLKGYSIPDETYVHRCYACSVTRKKDDKGWDIYFLPAMLSPDGFDIYRAEPLISCPACNWIRELITTQGK